MVVALLNPEIHAQFRNNMRACKCDSSNYFAEQIIHEEVPLCSSTLERILTPLFRAYTFFRLGLMLFTISCIPSYLGRPQEVTHDAVLVRYICSQCGRRFSVTYDFFVEGKVSECGEYTIKIRNRQVVDFPFSSSCCYEKVFRLQMMCVRSVSSRLSLIE